VRAQRGHMRKNACCRNLEWTFEDSFSYDKTFCLNQLTAYGHSQLSLKCSLPNRPVTAWDTRGSEGFSERDPNFWNYVQQDWNMSNTFFQGGGEAPLCPPWLRACCQMVSVSTFLTGGSARLKRGDVKRYTVVQSA